MYTTGLYHNWVKYEWGKVTPFIPWANTIAYFPFETDTLDHSWKWVTLSSTQYFSKGSIWYTRSASQWSSPTYIWASFTNSNAKLISLWYKINSVTTTWVTAIANLQKYGDVSYYPWHQDSTLRWKIVAFSNSLYAVWWSMSWPSINAWHHLVVMYDGTAIKVAIDWVVTTLYNWAWYNFGDTVMLIWTWSYWSSNVEMSNAIIESQPRTAQKITNYYQKTKSKYWL